MNLKEYTYLGKANYANDSIESVAINSMLKEKINELSDDDLILTLQEALKCPRFKDNIKQVLYLLINRKTVQIEDIAILEELWNITWNKNNYAQDYLLEMIDDDAGSEYWEEFPEEILACQ